MNLFTLKKALGGAELLAQKQAANVALDEAIRRANDTHATAIAQVRTGAQAEYDAIQATLASAARRAEELRAVEVLEDGQQFALGAATEVSTLL